VIEREREREGEKMFHTLKLKWCRQTGKVEKRETKRERRERERHRRHID
jgi:hypothetical protein